MGRSYYEVLGVDVDASREEIRQAYRQRVKEVHPDRSDSSDAREEMQLVVEARDVLTDAFERRRYDRVGHAVYTGATEEGADTGADGHDREAAEGESEDNPPWAAAEPRSSDPSGPGDGHGDRWTRSRTQRVVHTANVSPGWSPGSTSTDGGTASRPASPVEREWTAGAKGKAAAKLVVVLLTWAVYMGAVKPFRHFENVMLRALTPLSLLFYVALSILLVPVVPWEFILATGSIPGWGVPVLAFMCNLALCAIGAASVEEVNRLGL